MNLNSDTVKDLITQSKGQFFTVVIKNRHSNKIYKINAKYIKSPIFKLAQEKLENEYDKIFVFDMRTKSFFAFFLSDVVKINIRRFKLTDYFLTGA